MEGPFWIYSSVQDADICTVNDLTDYWHRINGVCLESLLERVCVCVSFGILLLMTLCFPMLSPLPLFPHALHFTFTGTKQCFFFKPDCDSE